MFRRRARIGRPLRTRLLKVRAVLAGALVLGVGASMTLAAWTDQEYATATVTAGTFTIVSRTQSAPAFAPHDSSGSAVTLPFGATNLYPGQSVAAWIQITTAGSVPGSVQLTGVTAPTNGANGDLLRDSMSVRIVPGTAAAGSTPTCTTSTTGGVTYTGIATVPTLTALPLPASGAGVANYCIVMSVPLNLANGAQGGVVTPTWMFTGTSG